MRANGLVNLSLAVDYGGPTTCRQLAVNPLAPSTHLRRQPTCAVNPLALSTHLRRQLAVNSSNYT